MLLDGFFDRTPRFRQHAENAAMSDLLAFMGDPGNVDRMILLNDIAEMAPLSAIVAELENSFESRINFASLDVRQMIGSMIKDVLAPFGYEPFDRTLVRNSRYFKVSARYRKIGSPTLVLQKNYIITSLNP